MTADRCAARDPSLGAILQAEELRDCGLEACVGVPPVVLEIGFGRAELIMALAQANPDRRYVGVDVSRKRVEKAARRIARRELVNVKLVLAPAEFLLERILSEASIAECWICCPDPWPKRRHHRRRLFQPSFVERLAGVLQSGAALHVSTDHAGYGEWIRSVMSSAKGFENLHLPHPWSRQPPKRPVTAYEAEWLAEGRTIAYFDYRRD